MTVPDDRARLEETPEEPALDRTISPIAGRLAGAFRGKVLAFAGLLTGCAVFAFATWSADRPRPPRPPDQPARQVVAFEPAPPPTLARPGPDAPSLSGPDTPYVPALAPQAGDAAVPSPAPAPPKPAPLIAWSRGAGRGGPVDAAAPPPAGASPGAPETELDRLRRGARIGRAAARTLGDRNFLILAGTVMPCVLQTALDSSTPGLAACVLPQDVWSDNGAVVLLEKGTRVLGEHRGGLRQGQRRIFVLWTRAVTPNGVAVDLASPAADALGRGGFDGAVDTRFWDRFGAAVLLSVVDDAGDALADGRRRRSAGLPSDAAALAVESNADIPPVLRKAQGAEVAIFAAQDFDFSQVYGLQARTP